MGEAIALISFVVLGFVVWLIHGATNNRVREKDKELEEVVKVHEDNIKADNAGHGSKLDKRVRDLFKTGRGK